MLSVKSTSSQDAGSMDNKNVHYQRIAPEVAVVIPVLNEFNTLETCLTSLGLGTSICRDIIFLISDGGSTDGTVALIRELQENHHNIILLHNNERIQSAGINLAVEKLPEEKSIFIRCDAHALYPPNFIFDVALGMRKHAAESVVVPMDAIGETCFQKANAWTVDTPLGSGGAPHRGGKKSGFVDHGHHAGFNRSFFEKLGGYDTKFTHNEDAEYDVRVLKEGGNIYLDADIRIKYFPRTSPHGLWKQYYFYGKGRARNIFKHKSPLKLRQSIPLVNFILLLLSIAILPLSSYGFIWPIIYFSILLIFSIGMMIGKKSTCGLFAGIVLAIMHIGWAAGFIRQLYDIGVVGFRGQS